MRQLSYLISWRMSSYTFITCSHVNFFAQSVNELALVQYKAWEVGKLFTMFYMKHNFTTGKPMFRRDYAFERVLREDESGKIFLCRKNGSILCELGERPIAFSSMVAVQAVILPG